MTERLQVYRCNVCGNIVVVVHPGVGTLVCCGQPMTLLAEKAGGPGSEKHIPVVETTDEGVRVKVGSVEHPMVKDHYIEWIEVSVDGETLRKFLNPGDRPEALFKPAAGKLVVRAFCNKHGLWKAEA